ncbi:MAG: hypothetical protein NTY71_04115 [Methanoregula sp.]|nr:hypothetical protein [Methanoregula sp.]
MTESDCDQLLDISMEEGEITGEYVNRLAANVVNQLAPAFSYDPMISYLFSKYDAEKVVEYEEFIIIGRDAWFPDDIPGDCERIYRV